MPLRNLRTLLLVLTSAFIVAIPAAANATSFLACEFGPQQVFAVQYKISGSTLEVLNFSAPFERALGSAKIYSDGDSFRFNQSVLTSGSYGLALYDSDDEIKLPLDETGKFKAIGQNFMLYADSATTGVLVITAPGYVPGDNVPLLITTLNPSNSQLSAYSSCSSTIIKSTPTGESPFTPNVISFADATFNVASERKDIVSELSLPAHGSVSVLGFVGSKATTSAAATSLKRANLVKAAILKLHPDLRVNVMGYGKTKNELCNPEQNECAVVFIRCIDK